MNGLSSKKIPDQNLTARPFVPSRLCGTAMVAVMVVCGSGGVSMAQNLNQRSPKSLGFERDLLSIDKRFDLEEKSKSPLTSTGVGRNPGNGDVIDWERVFENSSMPKVSAPNFAPDDTDKVIVNVRDVKFKLFQFMTLKQRDYTDTCADSAGSFRNVVYRKGFSSEEKDVRSPSAINAIKNHDAACLGGPSLPINDALIGMGANPSISGWEKAKRSIGVLYSKSRGTIFCTVTAIFEKVVISAKHCLDANRAASGQATRCPDEASSGIPDSRRLASSAEDLVVFMYSEPAKPMQVMKITASGGEEVPPGCIFSRVNQNVDVVYLTLSSSMTAQPVSLAAKIPETKTTILIPGFHANLAYAADGSAMEILKGTAARTNFASRLATWTNYIRFDKVPTCRIFSHLKNGCVVHTCQVEEGWSGAPMLSVGEAGVLLFGVHSGAMVEASLCRANLTRDEEKIIDDATMNIGSPVLSAKIPRLAFKN